MTGETRDEGAILTPRHARAKKVFELGADLHLFLQRHRYRPAEQSYVALHLPEGRPHEQLEAYHRRHWITRDSYPRNVVEHSKSQRRSRPHVHLPESLLASQRREDVACVIQIADRDSGRCENEVAAARALELSP